MQDVQLSSVVDLEVYDKTGASLRFGDIFKDEKVAMVFIRHFFCGRCQDYVMALATIPQEVLEKAGVSIVVVACGEWQAISNYHDITCFQGRIFADPSRQIYHGLGMNKESIALPGPDHVKKSYATDGLLSVTLKSIWRGPIKNPGMIGKNGNMSQLGGDFVFGPGNTCSFVHHMENTEDHTEVSDFMRAAGVKYP